MSGRTPTCTARQILAVLQRAGWIVHHSSGSHHILRHPDRPGARVTVAMHARDIPRPILRMILKQAGLTEDEFQTLL